MVELYAPLSIWMQFASFSFILAGIHGDLLVIRLFLFLGYFLMLLSALLGSPSWPGVSNVGGISLDSLFWNFLGLYVHGASLFSLIRDEQPVEPKLQEYEAALWRMLYRTGGLSARLYQTIVQPHLHISEFKKDQEIPSDDYFYIIYQGLIHLRVLDGQGKVIIEKRVLRSGEMFDLKHVGMFAENTIFDLHRIQCTSMTNNTVLFCFRREDMVRIAQHGFAKGVWQALLINNLTYVVENYVGERYGSSRRLAPDSGIDKIFWPLQDWERPVATDAGSGSAFSSAPLQHLGQSIYNSFSPPWPFGRHPRGIRQTNLKPPSCAKESEKEMLNMDDNKEEEDRIRNRQRVSFCTHLHTAARRKRSTSRSKTPDKETEGDGESPPKEVVQDESDPEALVQQQ